VNRPRFHFWLALAAVVAAAALVILISSRDDRESSVARQPDPAAVTDRARPAAPASRGQAAPRADERARSASADRDRRDADASDPADTPTASRSEHGAAPGSANSLAATDRDSDPETEPNSPATAQADDEDPAGGPIGAPARGPRVVERRDESDHSLLLVNRDGELPWVRIEARYEYDPVAGAEEIAEIETFAADRVRVWLQPEHGEASIAAWAQRLGVAVESVDRSARAYDLVWDEVGIDTLATAMQQVLAERDRIRLAEPVPADFDAVELEFD